MNKETLSNLRLLLIDCSHKYIDIDTVTKQLTSFIDDLRKLKEKEKNKLTEDYHDLLSAIKFELEYLIREEKGENGNKLIRLRDRIFGSMLRNVHIINEKKRVTSLFNNFIKGITYLSGQQPFDLNQPAYHRKESCTKRGSKNTECLASNTASTRLKKQQEIRNCYIERLIYDDIWTTLIHSSQDINHINWLEETRKAYKKCFPDNELSCKVEYTDNNIPHRLTIYDCGNEDVYEKRYDTVSNEYIYPISLTRYMADGSIIREHLFWKEN